MLKLFGEIGIEVSVFVCSMVDSSGAGGLLGLLDFGMMVAPLIALNVPALRERLPCHPFPKGAWYAGCHRWCYLERLMNPDEIVIHEMQRHCVCMVFLLNAFVNLVILLECIRTLRLFLSA